MVNEMGEPVLKDVKQEVELVGEVFVTELDVDRVKALDIISTLTPICSLTDQITIQNKLEEIVAIIDGCFSYELQKDLYEG